MITVLEWCGVIVVVAITAMIVWSFVYAVVQVTKKRRRVHALRHRRAEMLRERSRR